MLMKKFAAAAVAGAITFAAAGSALAGDVYGASILPGASTWQVDGQPFMVVGTNAWKAKTLASGRRTVTVITADGRSVTQVLQFNDSDLASARGGQYWCVIAAENNGQPVLFMMTQDRCKGFIEAGN
jgi:ABC-type sugar transport system substrate-binding protein